jgi:Ca-activated chloride channel family protein
MFQCGKQALPILILLCAAGNAQPNNSPVQAPSTAKPPIQIFATIATKGGSSVLPNSSKLNATVDKQPAQVLSLRPAKDEKLLFAVMVDVSGSERARAQLIKDVATGIFEGLSNNQCHGYLVLVDQTVQRSTRPLQPSEVAAMIDKVGFGGGTALFDGIAQISDKVLGVSQNPDTPRRILILLSDGDDNDSHLTFANAEEVAEREGVAVFSLVADTAPGPGSPGFSGSSQGEEILRQVSKDTGGREIVVNKLSEGIAPLLAAIQGQSVLTIVPSQAADQKLHSLVVKTTEKDISVSVPAHILLR